MCCYVELIVTVLKQISLNILHIPLNQDGGSVHVVTRKVDLDQTSMAHMHTERHKCDQTQFSVANFCLDDSDDSCDPE